MVVFIGVIIWTVMYFGLLLLVLIPLAIYVYFLLQHFIYQAAYLAKFKGEDQANLQRTLNECLQTAAYYRMNGKIPLLLDKYNVAQNHDLNNAVIIWYAMMHSMGLRLYSVNIVLTIAIYFFPIFVIFFLPEHELNTLAYGIVLSWSFKVMGTFDNLCWSFSYCYLNIPSI